MTLLERNNWWIWLLLVLFSSGSGVVALGALLDCFDKEEWYANPKYWMFGFACLVFPAIVMMVVFLLHMTAQVAAKLEVPGKELYLSSFIWIICLIIPIIGWIMFIVMFIYLNIWIIVSLYRGNGEVYIK